MVCRTAVIKCPNSSLMLCGLEVTVGAKDTCIEQVQEKEQLNKK